MIDPVYKRLLAENAWLRQQIAELQENSRQRKDAKDSALEKKYGWTEKDSRIDDKTQKMYPMPDDADAFDKDQIEGRRSEAGRALRKRKNPHDIKKELN